LPVPDPSKKVVAAWLTSRQACVVYRVSVVGNSGSGKSWLARRIAENLGAPYVELDDINHLPGWTTPSPAGFLAAATDVTNTDRWVVDGNYRSVVVEGPVWRRADTVVWVDPPRHVVMRQIVHRTLVRLVTRQELWNGNRERLVDMLSWDPNKSISRRSRLPPVPCLLVLFRFAVTFVGPMVNFRPHVGDDELCSVASGSREVTEPVLAPCHSLHSTSCSLGTQEIRRRTCWEAAQDPHQAPEDGRPTPRRDGSNPAVDARSRGHSDGAVLVS
jgi:adenylate kinase family enzyme